MKKLDDFIAELLVEIEYLKAEYKINPASYKNPNDLIKACDKLAKKKLSLIAKELIELADKLPDYELPYDEASYVLRSDCKKMIEEFCK